METVTGDTIQGGNIWLIIRSADKCVLSKTLNCSFFFTMQWIVLMCAPDAASG